MFCFASKLPSICINQNYSMGVESCTFSSHLTKTGVWERLLQPPEAIEFGGGVPSA